MRNLCTGLLALVLLAGCNCSTGNSNIVPSDTGSSVGSVGSVSSSTGAPAVGDSAVPSIVDVTYSIDNWSIVLSSNWEFEQQNSALGLWIHKANGTNLMLDKRKCGGDSNYTICLIDSLRSFKDDTDADVQVSNERKVEINGMKVTSFDVKKADMSAIVWLTIRDGFVYILSCGGRNSKLGQECLNAADTLVIK